MNKGILFVAPLIFVLSSVFADSNRFYINGKIIDTMYVDSLEGLRVRDSPSLNGNKVYGLTHCIPVKIVAIGKETTIDQITAPWVEILIPRYEWNNNQPEYGWVFGGYLSSVKPNIKTKDPTKQELEIQLSSRLWKLDDGPFLKKFTHHGKYYSAKLASGGTVAGTYQVISSNLVRTKTQFGDEDYVSPVETNDFKVTIITEDKIIINNETYSSYMDAASYDISAISDFIYSNYHGESLYKYIFRNNPYNFVYTEIQKTKIADDLIKYGVSAEGSEYETKYHDYWNPIMNAHQSIIEK